MMLGEASSPFFIPVTGNVKIHKYTKFEQMHHTFNRSEHFHQKSSTGQHDARRSFVTVLHTSVGAMLKYISIQNSNKIFHAVQEL